MKTHEEELRREIITVNTAKTSLEETITRIENQINNPELLAKIATLKSEINNLGNKITTLKNEITDLKTPKGPTSETIAFTPSVLISTPTPSEPASAPSTHKLFRFRMPNVTKKY